MIFTWSGGGRGGVALSDWTTSQYWILLWGKSELFRLVL